MPVPVAAGLLRLTALYLLVGLGLLPWLYRRAWPSAAAGATGAGWGFRTAALPGTLLLWPLLLYRARHPVRPTGDDPRTLRVAQSVLILLAALVTVAALTISLTTRRPAPTMDTLPPALGVGR